MVVNSVVHGPLGGIGQRQAGGDAYTRSSIDVEFLSSHPVLRTEVYLLSQRLEIIITGD